MFVNISAIAPLRLLGVSLLVLGTISSQLVAADPASMLAVGKKAPDFSLKTLADKTVQLSEVAKEGPVVVVVLRGYPGYQCPICSRQVGGLISSAEKFSQKKANVILVYPGPAENLDRYAQEFIGSKEFPANFHFVLDPGYTFTNAYDLRWEAPRETAFPATLVLDRDLSIRYSLVSQTHGGRADVADVIAAIP